MKSSVFVSNNNKSVCDVDKVLNDYYNFYLKNGKFASSFSKDKNERQIYYSYYQFASNVSNFCLTSEQEKKFSLIQSIKQKRKRYEDLLDEKKRISNGSKKDLYDFLLGRLKCNDALSRAFEISVLIDLPDNTKKELYRIENIRRKVNYLALEIRMYIQENDLSPSSIFCKKCYVRSFDGKVMTMKCAYDFVREYVNYVDDDLLKELNSCHRIKKKLVKTWIC